jgi:hypothetical protein
MDAPPVGQRRSGDDDRAEQLGTHGGEHHDRPTRLAIADDARLAVCVGVQRGDRFEKNRLGARDVLDRLAGNRVGQKADEVAGMPRL